MQTRGIQWFVHTELWFPLRHFGVILYTLQHKAKVSIEVVILQSMADEVWASVMIILCAALVYKPSNVTRYYNNSILAVNQKKKIALLNLYRRGTEVYFEGDEAKTVVQASPSSLLGLQPRRKLQSFGCPSTDELSGVRLQLVCSSSSGNRRFDLVNLWMASSTVYVVWPEAQASISSGVSWVCKKRWSRLSESSSGHCTTLFRKSCKPRTRCSTLCVLLMLKNGILGGNSGRSINTALLWSFWRSHTNSRNLLLTREVFTVKHMLFVWMQIS